MDSDDALAFALADNRISELGTTDNDLLYQMLTDVLGDDEEFFDVLGWDDFSVAAIENTVISDTFVDPNGGWNAPEIVVSDASSGSAIAPLPPPVFFVAVQPVVVANGRLAHTIDAEQK